jgi:hypothetical protein
MTRFVLFALVVGLALAVGTAQALTLQGQAAYGWQATWTANNDGAEYWDNPSADGTPPGNIGFQPFIVGPPKQSYWGSASGAADPEVTFTSGGSDWAAIKIEIAGLANANKFGVYKKGNPSVKKQLFDGSAGSGASTVFNPITELGSTDFGFYLENPLGIWYTESSLNAPGETSDQHFVFFTAPPLVPGLNAYYIGAEDKPFSAPGSDRDYQDMVVYVANIPDASTWVLFLSGVPALALLRRKRA